MSAFVVEDKTINKVVTFLSMIVNDSWDSYIPRFLAGQGFDLATSEGKQKLAQAMSDVNVRAVNERYNESAELPKFTFCLNINVNKLTALKALKCWLYQCTEGQQPESGVYRMMERVGNMLCESIVTNLKEYKMAEWA